MEVVPSTFDFIHRFFHRVFSAVDVNFFCWINLLVKIQQDIGKCVLVHRDVRFFANGRSTPRCASCVESHRWPPGLRSAAVLGAPSCMNPNLPALTLIW